MSWWLSLRKQSDRIQNKERMNKICDKYHILLNS